MPLHRTPTTRSSSIAKVRVKVKDRVELVSILGVRLRVTANVRVKVKPKVILVLTLGVRAKVRPTVKLQVMLMIVPE